MGPRNERHDLYGSVSLVTVIVFVGAGLAVLVWKILGAMTWGG